MRYKEYNVNRVLEKALSLFWRKGFNGCSINELVNETGVNRFSLYHEFENKEGILYQSLNLYRARYCDENLSLLESDGDLERVMKEFYLSFLQDSRPVQGCYFIHIGTELADSNARVQECMDQYLTEIFVLLTRLLSRHGFNEEQSKFRARHLLGLYCTAMSFCLVHTPKERDRYISNSINLIVA